MGPQTKSMVVAARMKRAEVLARGRVSIPSRLVAMNTGGGTSGGGAQQVGVEQVDVEGIEVDMICEVEMGSAELEGARFSAVIRALRPRGRKLPNEALVVYDTLYDDIDNEAEAEAGYSQKEEVAEGVRAPVHPDRKVATTRETQRRRLREWVAISALHPVPPPPPAAWLSMVRPGDVLDGLHEGGWWEVAVKAVGSGSDSPSSSSPPPSASASGGADGIDGNTPPGQSSVTPFVVEMAARNGLVCTLKGAQLRPWIGSRFYA